MPLKGVHCVLGYVGLEDHRRCMVENPGPPCGVEPSILEMMTRPNMERAESGVRFSPSSLSTCHRQTVLSGSHDWFLDVRSGYKRIRGTIVHQGMGAEPPYPGVLGVVRELRMSAPINTKYGEQTFHGKPDLVVLNGLEDNRPTDHGLDLGQWRWRLHVKIVDYKTKDEVGHELRAAERKHVYQVNMYAWLVKKFLPGWLNRQRDLGWPSCDGCADLDTEHLQTSEGIKLPRIDEVVIDELSIVYLDMKRVRTFTSRAMLYDQGKMLSDQVRGRWVRRKPAEYEELELEPIHQFSASYAEKLIRRGIEGQVEAETTLAPPIEDEQEARIMCTNCPVRQHCYDIGKAEGYKMTEQAKYVSTTTD